MARSKTRKAARYNLHKATGNLTFAAVTSWSPPRDGKPGFGFAETVEVKGRPRNKVKIFFGERFCQEGIYAGMLALPSPLDLSRLRGKPRGGTVIVGEIEPSRKKGGRASHVFSWWAVAGQPMRELISVVVGGTKLKSQALRRRLRVGSDDTLWVLERIILHNDLQLAETLVKRDRGYEWKPEDENKLAVLNSVNMSRTTFDLLEDLCREVDPDLADFVAQIDGKFPDKNMGVAGAGGDHVNDHEDMVEPMDPLEIAVPDKQPQAQPQQQHFVGFQLSAPAAPAAPAAAPAAAPTWGQAAAGWGAAAADYDPAAVSVEAYPAAAPNYGNPPAQGTTPPYGNTPTYGQGGHTPKTPDYGDGGHTPKTPEWAEPESPTPQACEPACAAQGGGAQQ